MGLQCHSCKSTNTAVVKAGELAEKTGDGTLMTSMSGNINPALVGEIVREVFGVIKEWIGLNKEKEKNNRSVVVCKDCGFWEKV